MTTALTIEATLPGDTLARLHGGVPDWGEGPSHLELSARQIPLLSVRSALDYRKEREQADLDDLISLALSWHYPIAPRCYCSNCIEKRNARTNTFLDKMLQRFSDKDSYHWIDFAYKYGKVVYEHGNEPPQIPLECDWWKRPEDTFTFPVGRRSRRRVETWQSETIKFWWHQPWYQPIATTTHIACAISDCTTTSYAAGPCDKFICGRHSRDEQFEFIGRDLHDKDKWKDRRAQFQYHVLHADIVYGASRLWRTPNYKLTPLRLLDSEGIEHTVQVLPERVPVFTLPRLEELRAIIGEEHSNAEYDRRIIESSERALRLRNEYRPLEQKQLLWHEISKRPQERDEKFPRRKEHHAITEDPPEVADDAPFIPLEADSQLHKKIILFDFPWIPTKEQTDKWELRLRKAFERDHKAERTHAAKVIKESRKEIYAELKQVRADIDELLKSKIDLSRYSDPDNSGYSVHDYKEDELHDLRLRQDELLEWKLQLNTAFHVSRPKTVEQDSIENELKKFGIRRAQHIPKDADNQDDEPDSESGDVFEYTYVDSVQPSGDDVPEFNKRFTSWFASKPGTAQVRILKLMNAYKSGELGAWDRLLRDRDFQKFLSTMTVLDYGVPANDAADSAGVPVSTLRSMISRLLKIIGYKPCIIWRLARFATFLPGK
jgi:hypothetical protein